MAAERFMDLLLVEMNGSESHRQARLRNGPERLLHRLRNRLFRVLVKPEAYGYFHHCTHCLPQRFLKGQTPQGFSSGGGPKGRSLSRISSISAVIAAL